MNVSRTEFLQEVKEKVAYCIVRRRGYVKGGGTNHEQREQKGLTDEIGEECL